MRRASISMLLALVTIWAQAASIYEISFTSLEGLTISMSAYKGKQVLVAEFDASNPDRAFLKSLDTLFLDRQGQLIVIAVPVGDFGNAKPGNGLANLLKDTLGLHYLITAPSYAKKTMGSAQHPLLKWVTDKNLNLHLDTDISGDGDVFLFSGTGRLYSKFTKKFPLTGPMITKILNNQPAN